MLIWLIIKVIHLLYSTGKEKLTEYSSPSLSGRSQQRPLSLMWPQIFGAAIMNAFTSPSHRRPPLLCGHNFLANRVALLQRDYCILLYLSPGLWWCWSSWRLRLWHFSNEENQQDRKQRYFMYTNVCPSKIPEHKLGCGRKWTKKELLNPRHGIH